LRLWLAHDALDRIICAGNDRLLENVAGAVVRCSGQRQNRNRNRYRYGRESSYDVSNHQTTPQKVPDNNGYLILSGA
jgi:hypothetical protein